MIFPARLRLPTQNKQNEKVLGGKESQQRWKYPQIARKTSIISFLRQEWIRALSGKVLAQASVTIPRFFVTLLMSEPKIPIYDRCGGYSFPKYKLYYEGHLLTL